MKSDYDELLDALKYVPSESYDHYLRALINIQSLALRAAESDVCTPYYTEAEQANRDANMQQFYDE